MSREYLVFTFPSTYHALRAEKALKENGYHNCGEVIRVKPEIKLEIQKILEEVGIKIEAIHLIKSQKKHILIDNFFGF
ncbi:hypothetical protein BBF96_12755 [Anoxybacter fermentans]|uniref:Putative Se/S carrier protein-like domain-containing protein n=1 Tax=Anoxybacter fermentans TaxID=1323375 RepID=A0A3S9T0Z7_9FIRM|nr:DUF3343 domain-containing protein [Anoxybacter fermentans]AZR74190.1 hypothetical protein BBF96_12755 [Anoxybacter fermentans]